MGDNGVLCPVCVFNDLMSEFNGDVSLNNHKISLLSDPVSDSDAVNKSYLLNKINSIFNNDISIRCNSTTNLKNPVAPADASTKEYVDTCIAMQASQIPQALADPIDEIHLSNKRYVDRVVNDVKTIIDNRHEFSEQAIWERLMEIRDSLATAADDVIALQSTAAKTSERLVALDSTAVTTSTVITATAPVQHYVK